MSQSTLRTIRFSDMVWDGAIARGRDDVLVPSVLFLRLDSRRHDALGRIAYARAGRGRPATVESTSLSSGHRFPRDIILLAVRYYLKLGAAVRIGAAYPSHSPHPNVAGLAGALETAAAGVRCSRTARGRTN